MTAATRPTEAQPPVRATSTPPGGRPGWTADVVLGVLLVVAAGLWLVALRQTRTGNLDQWGLLAAFPVAWFVALVLALGSVVTGLLSRRPLRDGWMAAHLALVVLILYGTAALIEDAPRLPWVYKHIAVTRYLEANGSVNPAIDIYQRWPGFFALTAQLGEMMGLQDPVDWAGLAEPGFALVDALLVLTLTRALSRDRRWCWTATTLFCTTNWVAQNYFAPQALGYTLYLFIGLMVITTMSRPPGRLGLWLERTVGRVLRARPAVDGAPDDRLGVALGSPALVHRAWVVVAVLGAFTAVVASHQLTPYLILLALGPLFVLGYLRPVLLVVGMGVITLAYLVPNLDYVQSHFGLFSGFDPVANAVYSAVDRSTLLPGAVWQARGTQLISAVVYLTALVGLVRRVRWGGVRSALVVAWLMVAPVLVLAGQSYGGEGRLRVYLFSLPWCAMAAAWAFWPTERAPRLPTRVVLPTLVGVLTALFVLSYFQPEADYRVPRSDVVAAQWIDGQVRRGDVVLTTSPAFPLLVGPRYDNLSLDGSLGDYKRYFPQPLEEQDLRRIAADLSDPGEPYRLFVVFSDNQYRYDTEHGTYAPGELAALEARIGAEAQDRQVYDSGAVRIYELR
ncbi:hypothetical protein SAMN04488543_3265 [Friedmanniella luteola]|uniref:Dolichyl-phosphate-mannose-protein mannosyltransferase n=1 Tax=Friedmanniella luteola TaxID=546871 RepID=A0A1H1YDH5_9ACTN|nr:hypothetical protein [Friedmanniella luteola]SDT19329.1 hypothetical protein SAMN04488543_3265 [Friedmanniella luteola]